MLEDNDCHLVVMAFQPVQLICTCRLWADSLLLVDDDCHLVVMACQRAAAELAVYFWVIWDLDVIDFEVSG